MSYFNAPFSMPRDLLEQLALGTRSSTCRGASHQLSKAIRPGIRHWLLERHRHCMQWPIMLEVGEQLQGHRDHYLRMTPGSRRTMTAGAPSATSTLCRPQNCSAGDRAALLWSPVKGARVCRRLQVWPSLHRKWQTSFVGLLKTIYIRRIFVRFGTDFEKYPAYIYGLQQPYSFGTWT